jgi:hypothetical protein
MNNNWFKKEKPFATLIGMGGGATGLANAGGGGPTIEASGGIISEYSVPTGEVYRAHVFVGDGILVVSNVVGDGAIQYLLVGGGGAGGSDVDSYSPPGTYMRGGGGGGGGFRTNIPGHPLSASNPITVTTSPYPVDIGQGGRFGGQPGNEMTLGFRGSKTIINHPTTPVQADGGGGGGSSNPASGGIPGATGGGGGSASAGGAGSGGSGNTPPYNPVQGYDGGTSAPTTPGGAGGGGGAGGAGGSGPTGRTGGAAVLMAVEDGTTPVYYGGGGGGGTVPTSRSSSGDGQGSGYSTDPIRTNYGQGGGLLIPTSGPVQTRTNMGLTNGTGRDGMSGFGGGGGGAGQYATGGQGGTGCAIIRYPIPATTGTAKASGGMISYYNGKVIHTFRATGTFTTNAGFNETVEYFVVGGGGAGGFDAGGGGGAGEVLTGTTPINTPQPAPNNAMTVTVGMGGRGFGLTEQYAGYGERSGGFGWLSAFASSVPGSPFNFEAGGGNFGGGPSCRGGPTGTDPTNAGAVVNRTTGCGGGSSGGNPTPQSASPTGMPYGGEGDPNGGGGGGGAGGNGTPSDSSPTPSGVGGIGVQCPTTFRNPMSSVGYPGPNGENWWFAGGGAGGSKGTGNPGPNPTNPGVLHYGNRGGGPTAANSPTLPSENATGSDGISQNDNCYWCGAGNGQGYKNCLNVPTYYPFGQHITWRGMGGQAAANSGSGGGGGVGFAYNGFGPTGSNPTKRGVSGGGGPGGPGIVMIAYPE